MPIRCKQCGGRIGSRGREATCECGWRLEEGCREAHEAVCPSHGDERWVGVQEF